MRSAIIGAGQIAKQHLGALQALPDVAVVGVCDLSPVSAEAAAERFGIRHWYTDYARMLAEQQPDVVHILTPAPTHPMLAAACLNAGCHTLVEKPLAASLGECEELIRVAESADRWLIEDYNYQFNRSVQQIVDYRDDGDLGEVRHVDVQMSLPLFEAGSRFADADLPHPAMREPAGAVSDFLTHLCYLANLFVGPHSRVETVWKRLGGGPEQPLNYFQAFIEAESATALIGLTTDSELDGFTVRVRGTKMVAETNLFETGVVATKALGGPKPLLPIRNHLGRAGLERAAAIRSLSRKLSGGPGPYEGLWELVRRTYEGLQSGGPPPVRVQQIIDVNRLCADITDQAVAA